MTTSIDGAKHEREEWEYEEEDRRLAMSRARTEDEYREAAAGILGAGDLPSALRPLAVRQLIECLQREHCWSGAGCPYRRGCTGGPAESLGKTRELVEYLECLEAEVAVARDDENDPAGALTP